MKVMTFNAKIDFGDGNFNQALKKYSSIINKKNLNLQEIENIFKLYQSQVSVEVRGGKGNSVLHQTVILYTPEFILSRYFPITFEIILEYFEELDYCGLLSNTSLNLTEEQRQYLEVLNKII